MCVCENIRFDFETDESNLGVSLTAGWFQSVDFESVVKVTDYCQELLLLCELGTNALLNCLPSYFQHPLGQTFIGDQFYEGKFLT